MKHKTVLLLLLFGVTLALAQGRGKGMGPMYDPNSETTVTGPIEEVKTLDSMCHSGTHLLVKTDKGTLEVALGPSQFLTDQKLDLNKGDQVQIVGANANTRTGEMFIARQITSGGKTVTLRDGKGVPAWPRGLCR
ncbi:MAG TPA: hypothetical protein VKW06_19370 [Candidatus Angelobacter sp.]|nr:hypothetical protein [Candidatus Angelobacter sp.]